MGQAFLIKNRYGMTVKHIEPHHVSGIPIPFIPEIEEEIGRSILEAHRLRKEAQEALLEAEGMIYSELELPKIDEEDADYLGGDKGRIVKSFEVKAGELNLRLDASYQMPIVRLVEKYLTEHRKHGKYGLSELRDFAKVFHLPTYKRIYVSKDAGLPILSGSHLRQIKPFDLKYISRLSFYKHAKSVIDQYRIEESWVLTTERGTIGVSSLVTEYWDQWLASHNILRIVPTNIAPGYLLAYLNTDYAQLQIKSKGLGAVVEVLDPRDMEDIIIPIPEQDIQSSISSLVTEAYHKRDRANQIESEAVELLERKIEEIGEA